MNPGTGVSELRVTSGATENKYLLGAHILGFRTGRGNPRPGILGGKRGKRGNSYREKKEKRGNQIRRWERWKSKGEEVRSEGAGIPDREFWEGKGERGETLTGLKRKRGETKFGGGRGGSRKGKKYGRKQVSIFGYSTAVQRFFSWTGQNESVQPGGTAFIFWYAPEIRFGLRYEKL